MPQILTADQARFDNFIRSQGYDLRFESVNIHILKIAQGQINYAKVMDFLDKPDVLRKPFYISEDYYIADGNHRFCALFLREPNAIVPVKKISLPIRQLLKVMFEFGGTFTKRLAESNPLI